MDSTQASTAAVSALALVASVVMAWRTLRRQRRVPPERKDAQFRRFTKRRLIMSGLVGLVGIMLFLGVFILQPYFAARHPLAFGLFWLAVIAILVWLLGLAISDIYAVLYAQLADHYKSEEQKPETSLSSRRTRGPEGKP